jgi:hypothetical protein
MDRVPASDSGNQSGLELISLIEITRDDGIRICHGSAVLLVIDP